MGIETLYNAKQVQLNKLLLVLPNVFIVSLKLRANELI